MKGDRHGKSDYPLQGEGHHGIRGIGCGPRGPGPHDADGLLGKLWQARGLEGGDLDAMSPVRVLAMAGEDAKRLLRRLARWRERLVKERVRLSATVAGLLRPCGTSPSNPAAPGFRKRLGDMKTGHGAAPPRGLPAGRSLPVRVPEGGPPPGNGHHAAALREQDTAGRQKLPPPRGGGAARKPASSRPLMLSTPLPQATDVPDRVDGVSGLAVQLVDTKAEARLLARLPHDGHPQGAVRHGGRQLRYVINSDHGVLGGALRLPAAPNDRARPGVPVSDVAPPPRPKRILAPSEGLAMNVWAANEFGDAPLAKPLVKRLVKSAGIQAMAPSKTFSAAGGDEAAVIGYCRMIDRPDTEAFTPAAYRERSPCRIGGAKTALPVQGWV